MHKDASNTAYGSQSQPWPRRKIALWALVVSAGLLVVAWIDGGEEPIHAIETPVALTTGGNS